MCVCVCVCVSYMYVCVCFHSKYYNLDLINSCTKLQKLNIPTLWNLCRYYGYTIIIRYRSIIL